MATLEEAQIKVADDLRGLAGDLASGRVRLVGATERAHLRRGKPVDGYEMWEPTDRYSILITYVKPEEVSDDT